MLDVEIVDDPRRFTALRAEWTALLADSDAATPFLSWEWLHTWWRHLAGPRRLRLMLVRRGRDLVAIAPFALRPRRAARPRSLPFVALEFLGTGTVGSDYLDVIVQRGEASAALPALAARLAEQRCLVELAQVDADSTAAAALGATLAGRDWAVTRAVTDVCPYVDFGADDWEAYLGRLGAAHRYNLRRRTRNLARHFAVQLETARDDARRRASLGTLVALHRARWSSRGGSDALDAPAVLAFHEEWTRLALERGWLRLHVLRLDDRPAAALYGLRFGDTFHFYQAGFDPAYERHSVGLVMQGFAIRGAVEEGARRYDFLHGSEGYKALWARQARRLARVTLYPPTLAGALCRATTAARNTAKRWALGRDAPPVWQPAGGGAGE